ncbi:hypothetical protein [Acinetobacter sp. ANC 4648]|uniref:hypothetical protein n=1 Tax=Acinetobacter sp. ANC 4648 TaxID=1977875 RepID=UPI000A34B608|nr:hypothetical protein [Acinetobacter sp. ANC 4648]OTG82253.1 hypothetical protein B9T27_08365 [Acinetobacter sp. ANC 4648]
MEQMVQLNVLNNHQQTARKLLDISANLMQIFQDQWFYLADVTAQNMLRIDTEQHVLSIANGMWNIHFSNTEPLFQIKSKFPHQSFEKIAQFILLEIPFFTGNFVLQHPTTVKAKTQVLRQTLIEQIFVWVDGESRIEQYLYTISEKEAIEIDRLLIAENYYTQPYLTAFAQQGKQVPLQVELNIKHLCLINSVQGESFVRINELLPIYDQLCFSASALLPKALFRIVETQFLASFRLIDMIERQQDMQLLMQHAIEQPNVLGFTNLMLRGYWQHNDLFSKQNFLNQKCPYWDESQLNFLPIFAYQRTVNWLFKQDCLVIDWISRNIGKPSVPMAITALSFVDTSKIHPQVILLTLKYFRDISARLFVYECHAYAKTHFWFNHPRNQKYSLDSEISQLMHTQRISNSVLYLEEWLDLLQLVSEDNVYIAKQVFQKQSRVMQAYMQFLQKIVDGLNVDLIAFIDPKTHEYRGFFSTLQKQQLSASDFRQAFHHPALNFSRRISVFDSYVADYLVDFFLHDKEVKKSVTWSGLFQQAVHWHQQLQHETTLNKLRLRIRANEWVRLSPEQYMYYGDWQFEELHQLDRIIHESADFNHCLAVAYSQRMSDGEYVAFHMTSQQDPSLHLTLGCLYEYDQLSLEQLKFPNNRDADIHSLNIARLFVAEFNLILRQRSIEAQR